MADIGGFLSKGFNFSSISTVILTLVVSLIALGIIGAVFYFFWIRKKWNIPVEFKLPRGIRGLKDGDTIDVSTIEGFIGAEWGKGYYDTKQGVVWVKRKGMQKVSLRPFDIKRYLQGASNILTVIQVGATQYEPVLPESYIRMVDDSTGEEAVLLRISMEGSENRSWKNSFEREAKNTYSVMNMLKEYAQFIGIGILLFFNFVGFAILWGKVT
jgi:hypothetical protein